MSITVTLSGAKSALETYFHPPLSLEDKYECGLLYFSAYNSIPNVDLKNNTFCYGNEDKQLKLPPGSYDFYDICDHLESNLTDCEIIIRPNNNTLKCSLFCSKIVNFDVENSIGGLLGFSKSKLEPNRWHESVKPVNILPVSIIRIECDLIQGSFTNGLPSHTIHEFVASVPPGYKYIEVPRNVIYFPINKRNISSITIKVVDENGNLVNFREEKIQLRIHLRKTK